MNIVETTERRAVLLNSTGLWTFNTLIYGKVVASEGFRIVRQNQIAVYFEAQNGPFSYREAE